MGKYCHCYCVRELRYMLAVQIGDDGVNIGWLVR